METIIKQIQEALNQEIRLDYTVNKNLMQRGIADIIEQDVSEIILNLKSRIIKESYEAKSKRSSKTKT